MKTSLKKEINTQLGNLNFPTVLITIVTNYLTSSIENNEKQELAGFLLKILADLSLNSKFAALSNATQCEKFFLIWLPDILTALSKNKPVEKPFDQNRPMRFISEDMLKEKHYPKAQDALYELLTYTHKKDCFDRGHVAGPQLNFIFMEILTKVKLIDTVRGNSFCLALHELAGIYRFNITKNMATGLYKELVERKSILSTDSDQLIARKKDYQQLGFDCRYLNYNEHNGYLTLFPVTSIKQVIALESKHLPIQSSYATSDSFSITEKMLQKLNNFVNHNVKTPGFLRSTQLDLQINKCRTLINMLENLDLNRNIAVQTALAQVSVYKSKSVTNDFQKTLDVVFNSLMTLSQQLKVSLPLELHL